MKLRNKKTGEIVDLSVGYIRDVHNSEFIQIKPVACLEDKGSYRYDTFAKFSEDWEDYKPKEPLIKDEKIRKAVRVWAEVNDVKKVTVEKDFSTYAFYPADTDRVSISIWTEPSLSNLSRGNVYTIEELCGEEKE